MMEDRLVFPIPPGTHWSDAKPIVLPRHTMDAAGARQLEDAGAARVRKIKPATTIAKRQALSGGLMFQSPESAGTKVEKPKRQKKAKIKNDPKYVSAVRELRDRWLERVNDDPSLIGSRGKYEISRELSAPQRKEVLQLPHSIAA
jgi:hypothetical protein